jgi:transcriptional regulator with XRE-family HTH domain
MYTGPRRRSDNLTRKLHKQAGCWLRELREERGLSQRELAQKVGAEYYTLISQLAHGYGRIPPNRCLAWTNALAVEPQVFVRRLMMRRDLIRTGSWSGFREFADNSLLIAAMTWS